MTINLSREERAASPNRGATRLPAVSPGFINEADAAYWAHKKIGARRNKEYGGVILRKYTGRYHATEPVPGKGMQFDLHEVLAVGADGLFEQPKGYTCVASYHSHPADHVLTQKANPDFDSKTVKAFLSFFSDSDFWHGVNNRAFFPAAYLSGPDGSLIRYAPSGSAEEFSFALWIRAGRPPNSKVALFGPFSTFVKKLSTLGSLSLIVPTPLWGGSVGEVPADWVVFEPFSNGTPTRQPLFTGVFVEVGAAISACEPVVTPERQVSIVIKAQGEGRAEYAVSQPEPAQMMGWLAGGALPVLPAGWELHGMFVDASPCPEPYPPMQAWLYQRFISPLELATHIVGYRRFAKAFSVASAGWLYIRTSDAAVLRYGFSGSDAETQLFAQAADGSVTDNGIQALLQAGTLLPQAFVKQVAEAGQLSVERTSNIWDKTGAVDKMWRPFSKIPEPQLGPPFITADDAACWAHEVIGTRRDLEYGGVILKRGYRYYATHPIPDQRNSFEVGLVLGKLKDGSYITHADYSVEAFYHSHSEQAGINSAIRYPDATNDQRLALSSFYSEPDQRFSFYHRAFAKTHYLSGAVDVLLKYVSSGSALEQAYGQELRGRAVRAGDDFESGKFWKLAEAGELSVVIPNPIWGGVRGRISKGWRIRTPAAAQQQPFFTGAYSRPEHAVIRALSLAGPDDTAAKFGFVLKHKRENIYAATLAMPKSEPLFSPVGLFPKRRDGGLRLPAQYQLEAIYFSSWYATDEVAAQEKWLASTFFTPAQIVAATRQSRATLGIQDPVRGLSLYMQASDGALLAFKVPEATPTSDLVRTGSEGEVNDNGAQAAMLAGTLSPRDFVRRVIAATDLAVVQAGGLWRTVGKVENRTNLLMSLYTGTLSRAFLSARDAAVYAHERIGSRRDRYYGGYVLEGEDGRFVITEPVESRANPFAFRLFFPANNNGPLIPPEPYTLYGRYGSHPELSMADPAPVLRRGWTLDEALINQQVFGPEEINSIIPAGQVAYLSGAANCLLEYTPDRSAGERLLLDNIGPQAGSNSLQRRLDSGEVKPGQWVWRLAEAGNFKIIQGNPLWGPRSVVYNDWTANYTYAPRSGPPDYVIYGAVFASADAAAQNLHGRVHGRNFPEADCFAFILKHKDQEQYIASEVVGASDRSKLFNLNSMFERNANRGYRLPDGFELYGLFRSQQWSPTGLNTSNAWLTLFFVTPDVLFTALYAANREGANFAWVYFSTLDGALLRYEPAPLDVRSGGPAETLLTLAQEQLNSGLRQPLDFVREWALKRRLYVVSVSQYWDKKGPVADSWAGYESLMPRRLSPAFANPDDAARHAATLVRNRQRVHGGVILRLANRLFVATDPLVLPPRGLALHWIYPDQAVAVGLYPGGSTIVARYRSVVDQEVPILLSATQKAIYKSMLPTAVLSNLLHREAHIKREYVFGVNGSILSYQLSDSAEQLNLRDRLAPLNRVKGDYGDNSIEQQLRSGALSPQAFISELANAGELCVVQGNPIWGAPRKIPANNFVANQSRPNPGDIRQVLFDSPCGPIFTRALDAVRYAQRMWVPQLDVAFGYVLKSVNKPLYMTTLALVRDNLADFKQVFVNGQLPQGYVLDGVYLCASNAAIASASDEMTHSFFAPQHIAKALNFISNARNGMALPLYLMCSDGALLKYVFPKTASLYDFTSSAHLERTQLLEGALTVSDYVRRLARAGELSIRVTSEVWGRKEQVTRHWVPKQKPHAFAQDPYFHSFCGPLFLYPDDAARYAQGLVAPFKGKQYLGAVLVPGDTSGYVALDPVEDQGTGTTSTLQLLFWIDHKGFDVPPANVLGTYKIAAVQSFYKAIASTRSFEPIDKKLLENFVSKDDLRDYLAVVKSNAPDAVSCYLACRGGALLKYLPVHSAVETTLLAPGAAPDPSVWVSRLREQGVLSVLVTDSFWTREGVLGEEWKVSEVQAEPNVDEYWYVHTKDEL